MESLCNPRVPYHFAAFPTKVENHGLDVAGDASNLNVNVHPNLTPSSLQKEKVRKH